MKLTRKTMIAMKLTIVLLTAAFLQVSASGTAQNVTWTGKEVPLEKVFSVIKKQTNYFFFYRNDDLAKAKTVTAELRNVPLEQALEAIFKNQPLTYSIEGNTVVVSEKPPVVIQQEKIGVAPLTAPPIEVKGIVTSKNGPVAGASILIKRTGAGDRKSVV